MNKIDEYLESVPEWQKTNLTIFRQLVHEVVPGVKEDWKWNVPVFLINDKTQFAMSGFKAHTKYNFILNGALVDDPRKLFNNGLESKKSRGIDLHEGDVIDKDSLRALIKASVQYT